MLAASLAAQRHFNFLGTDDLLTSPSFQGPSPRSSLAQNIPCTECAGIGAGIGAAHQSRTDSSLGKCQESFFLLSLQRPRWNLVVRVKAGLAPGASGPARPTGAVGGAGQLVPGSQGQRDKRARQGEEAWASMLSHGRAQVHQEPWVFLTRGWEMGPVHDHTLQCLGRPAGHSETFARCKMSYS